MAKPCAAAENGMESCNPDHVARGVVCEVCAPPLSLEAVLALPSVAAYPPRRLMVRVQAAELLCDASQQMEPDGSPHRLDGALLPGKVDGGTRLPVAEALRAAGLVRFVEVEHPYVTGPKVATRMVLTETGRSRLERMLDVLEGGEG